MDVLELKNLKEKKVVCYLIEDGNIEFTEKTIMNLNTLLEVYDFQFVTIDSKDEKYNKSHEKLLEILRTNNKPYFHVDIPQEAKGYLYEEISRNEEQVEELMAEYKLMCKSEKERNSFKSQNLKSWIDYLRAEVYEKEMHLNLQIRPQWIVKKILDLIDLYKKDKMYILHFSPKEIVPQVRTLLEECNVVVVFHNIKREFLVPEQVMK